MRNIFSGSRQAHCEKYFFCKQAGSLITYWEQHRWSLLLETILDSFYFGDLSLLRKGIISLQETTTEVFSLCVYTCVCVCVVFLVLFWFHHLLHWAWELLPDILILLQIKLICCRWPLRKRRLFFGNDVGVHLSGTCSSSPETRIRILFLLISRARLGLWWSD